MLLRSLSRAQSRIRAPPNSTLLARTVASSAMAAPEEALSRAPFAILRSVQDVRRWRQQAFDESKTVGFVPTMGALHQGHLELVRQSLKHTDQTVASIFVNPAQFAPTEDLGTYPRTIEADIQKLESLEVDGKKLSALFLPGVTDLYPDGIEQDVSRQRGTFVEVKGYSQEMEGASRPTFFRGVATVVTKLFNITQPSLAFFGQKDIQQCLILRRMISDLHLPHPPSAEHLRIVPTVRDSDQLALSSRNAYLTTEERQVAPLLFHALKAAEKEIYNSLSHKGVIHSDEILTAAKKGMSDFVDTLPSAVRGKVDITLDYFKCNDPLTLQPLEAIHNGQAAVLSGAIKVGRTRLIDNLLINIAI